MKKKVTNKKIPRVTYLIKGSNIKEKLFFVYQKKRAKLK